MKQSPDLGLYGPDSLTWRLSRSRAMLLGGPRALLLQVAHPLVAAGVVAHSSFRADPIRRLRRTLATTLTMVFGTVPEAQNAARVINTVHERVHGVLPEAAGRYPAGASYEATDPELLLWVHATLVDTTLRTYTRFVAPLRPDEMARAYEESKTVALLLGVTPDILPRDLGAFRDYFDGMIASDRIAVAPFQRELARDILYPPVRFVPRGLFRPATGITIGLLPPIVAEKFGFDLTPARRRVGDWSAKLVRGMLPLVPTAVRDQPQARRAMRRARV